jgi:glycosyltransferase involved in cell wall biosynthesis/lipopolysaccharide biosynthesis glycosyltransferase
MIPITVCTIISKNYLAHARTFTNSFLANNSTGKVFVLLVDELDSSFIPENEKFTLVKLEEIELDCLEEFCFKYNILEQNTGVKAHFLKYLLKNYNLEKVAYFDPDILVTNSLENLWKVLDKKDILLTPHITKPIKDDRKPSEYDILLSGTYNLGFIALKNTTNTRNFLDWWNKHITNQGYSDPKSGLFTDQKWMDLVPVIFENTFVIKHLGYNIAYWNLGQRNIEIKDDKIYCNSKPVYFFHFSGFSPENIERVSKHQNRFSLSDIENARPLFEMYRDLLIENGYLEIKKLKCKFDYFDNGVKIPQFARNIYRNLKNRKKFGNPFQTSSSHSFFEFLNQSIDNKKPIISNFWYQAYLDRDDLKKAFPDPLGKDRERFSYWIIKSGLAENPSFESFVNNFQEFPKLIKNKKYGVNISGYFKGEFGVGQSARNYVSAIKKAGIPYVLNNIEANSHKNSNTTFENFQSENPYSINLMVINADQIPVLYKKMGSTYFQRYNIGVWAWELEDFPDKWIKNLDKFDEIWGVSSFVSKSISKKSKIPVIPLPCPIQLDEDKISNNKEKFGIDKNKFVFLFVFDFLSFSERKNPVGLIKSFSKAIPEPNGAELIIKCINGDQFPNEFNRLKTEAKKNNVILMTMNLEKNDLLSLVNCADCFVSLHRSEGFGLTIAEAMYLEKPVIATSYGGNMDFMNKTNSFPVKYKLKEITKDEGPYSKGNFWAEPDLEDASHLIRYVFENQQEAKLKGKKGAEEIRKIFSPEEVGKKIKARLEEIRRTV